MTKAIRGAVQFSKDSSEIIQERVQFLITAIMEKNLINEDAIISIFFSVTNDLRSINPAAALRKGGRFADTALFCAQEPAVENAMPRVIRVMMTCEIDADKTDLQHVYIDGAEKLRPDLS